MGRTEYALNVNRKTGGFLYQVDCYQTIEEAKTDAATLELESDEVYDIIAIEYDDNDYEIDSYSVL